ncbi:MAG: phospho-N-acetylmuramoyl-pentapeptide-transferase, partial [Mycobacteriales bacterium]
MRSILVAGFISFLVSIFGTPWVIRFLTRYGIGQEIRTDGPTTHQSKRGTPTMGGVLIIAATIAGFAAALLADFGAKRLGLVSESRGPSKGALLLLGLFVALGALGFVDDFISVRRQRSLGLDTKAKLVAQFVIAVTFALLALRLKNARNQTPDTILSFPRGSWALPIGVVGFVVLVYLIVTATSNAVNLTDGLDGLATGTSVMVLISYTLIGFWEFRHACIGA